MFARIREARERRAAQQIEAQNELAGRDKALAEQRAIIVRTWDNLITATRSGEMEWDMRTPAYLISYYKGERVNLFHGMFGDNELWLGSGDARITYPLTREQGDALCSTIHAANNTQAKQAELADKFLS